MHKQISFGKTDGSSSRWPVCGKLPDGGSVDRLYSDDKHVVQFLAKLATQLAEHLNYPSGTHLRIDGFPDGYGLFGRSTKAGRQDRYLRGSIHVKYFRSATEFTPHAVWLLTDPFLDPSNCECQYCHKRGGHLQPRTQLARMRPSTPAPTESGLSPVSPPHLKRYASHQARRSSRQTSSGLPQRSVRGVSRQVSLYETPPQQDGIEQKTSLPAQLSDIAALAQNRLYRDQELVWYILDEPLRVNVRSHPEMTHVIHFWPGIARTTVCPSPLAKRPSRAAEGSEIHYFVKVATLNRTYVVPQASIIPFQSHAPDEELLARFRSIGADIPLNSFDRKFDPLPRCSTLETSLSLGTEEGISPLEMLVTDIGIANQVASMWSVTDEFSPDPNARTASNSPSLLTISPGIGETLVRTSSFNSTGVGRAQRGYRGLWLGAERIWTGDLLILSFPESGIGFERKTSTRFIQDTKIEERVDDSVPEHRNPEDKQVFLKLRSLTPVVTGDGKRIYVTGDLYRLLPSSGFAPDSQLKDDAALPQPPDGFAFGSILSKGIEAKFPVDLIRGRYYPRILSLVDRQFLPEERTLKSMEGRCRTDLATRRPIKHMQESREDLLEMVRKSMLQVG